MKKIILYSALSLTLAAVGCQDEYEAPDSLYDVAWCVNQTAAATMERNQGEFMSFLDMSVNASSHMWGIEEGNYFLNSGFGEDDSLHLFINEEMGLETSDVQVNVLLNNPGINKVRLRNTFDEKVSWNGSVPLEAVYDADIDKWVIDTLLEVYVYATMEPAAAIYKQISKEVEGEIVTEDSLVLRIDGKEIYELEDSLNWPVVNMMAGEQLIAIDETNVGEPGGRTWAFPGSNVAFSGDSVASAPFYSIGTFAGISLTSIRAYPQPEASVVNFLPIRVKVNKSTIPFSASGDAVEQANESLVFGVTGEIKTLPATAASDFTVHVTNSNGFSGDIAIKSLKKDIMDATKLVITLSDPIYNSDEVTITYNGASSEANQIVSADERILQAFTDVVATMYYAPSVFDNPMVMNFEVAGSEPMFPADGWWTPAPANWFRSVDYFSTGAASVCCKGTDLNGERMQASANLPAGSFVLRCDVYVDSSVNENFSGFNAVFTAPTWNDQFIDLSAAPKDEWVTVDSPIYTVSEAATAEFWVKAAAAGDILFYVDNFQLLEIEMRP